MQHGETLLFRQLLQILSKTFHAFLTEAAAVHKVLDWHFCFIQLDSVHSGVDLDADDSFQILAPGRMVTVHHVTLVLAIRAFHPACMTWSSIDVARNTVLDKVGDLVAIAVDQPIGKVLFERRPEFRVAVLPELTQSHPDPFAFAA